MRQSTILRKNTPYGYADEAEFRQTEENGVKRWDLYLKERWEDGHFTYPNFRHLRFHSADEGNKLYREYLADGFQRI